MRFAAYTHTGSALLKLPGRTAWEACGHYLEIFAGCRAKARSFGGVVFVEVAGTRLIIRPYRNV